MHTQAETTGADHSCFCPYLLILIITFPDSFGKPPLCSFQMILLIELANGFPHPRSKDLPMTRPCHSNILSPWSQVVGSRTCKRENWSRINLGTFTKPLKKVGLPRWLSGKEPARSGGDAEFDPWSLCGREGLEWSRERKMTWRRDMATDSRIFAWPTPWTEGPGGLPSIG